MRLSILLTLIILFLSNTQAISQREVQHTIRIKKGLQVVLRDTIFITKRDTVLSLSGKEFLSIKIKKSPYVVSGQFYDTLSKRASNHKITKDIFGWVVKKKGRKEKIVNVVVKSEQVFMPYTGYIIESITFKGVDLIEGSVIDTLQKSSTKFGIFINTVHRDTRAKIIEHNLLFRVGDKVDPYHLADNERILRQFRPLRDARIYLSENKNNSKGVDVVVVTQDVASLGVSGSFSSWNKFRMDLYDINILGYAQQLKLSYFRNANALPHNGYEITLLQPNFRSTFIQSELQYTHNYLRERTRLALGRDFITPEIKYAYGLELYRTHEKFYFEEYDTLELPYTENNIDVWAGRSLQLSKRTNLIFSARVSSRTFTSNQFVSGDSNSFFYDRTLFLSRVTFIKRNYLKTLRIQGFGKTEDVLVGGAISILFGNEVNPFSDRYYGGLDGSIGRYFKDVGYLNFSLSAGSFVKRGSSEDGLVTLAGTYFSDLVKLRKMQVRQFIFFTYTKGFYRVLDRTISLPGKWQDQYDRPPLGSHRMTLGFETVYFMPWYVYGFQFAIFERVNFNLLSKSSVLLSKTALFPSIQCGVRMLNENLVLPRFAFDLTYFGKNQGYGDAWQFKFSTTLPNLFGTGQAFKPEVSRFE